MMKFIVLPQLSISAADEDFSVVVAGGRRPDNFWFKEVSKDRDIYCVDKGIEAAFDNGFVPKLLLGDCDSTDIIFYEKTEKLGTVVDIYPKAKDDTDLQLILKKLPNENFVFTGIWGGRFDHLYANVYSLLNHKLFNKKEVIMADEKEIMLLISDEKDITIKLHDNPKAISILPLSSKVSVSIKNVRWELEKSDLSILKPYAISNEALDEMFSFKCFEGLCGLYIVF